MLPASAAPPRLPRLLPKEISLPPPVPPYATARPSHSPAFSLGGAHCSARPRLLQLAPPRRVSPASRLPTEGFFGRLRAPPPPLALSKRPPLRSTTWASSAPPSRQRCEGVGPRPTPRAPPRLGLLGSSPLVREASCRPARDSPARPRGASRTLYFELGRPVLRARGRRRERTVAVGSAGTPQPHRRTLREGFVCP
nr:proline-rich receptor-like protein kinase PERK9 [Saimiri boliviensis boliviensis]